ncbi:MAG: hypothetical protein HY671_00350 [Chloroflexi bacterium]|nr:hypothetical protein [Chloroflexota bacterium]
MNRRAAVRVTLLGLFLLSMLLLPSGAAFRANSVEGLASPYFFSLVRWEAASLWNEVAGRVSRRAGNSSQRADIALVEEYFRLGQEAATLQRRLEQLSSAPGRESERTQIEARILSLKQQRADRGNGVRRIVARQIGQALEQEGIPVRPPVLFAFDAPPQLLVISPRERIELKETLLLDSGVSLRSAVRLERQVEALPPPEGHIRGLSALAEPLGGLAAYPSLIPETDSLERAIPTIAHEWTHHYLFFQPLGRRYGADNRMTTINETVADIVGDEVGGRVLQEYGRKLEKGHPKKPSGFDFNQEMRQTRLKADELLAEGKVPEAEAYMEERRQFLEKNGYFIRRLNQAYFAFHGSYGDSPASVSPVAGWLRDIRARSSSLGEFLKTAARIASYEELERLAQGNR